MAWWAFSLRARPSLCSDELFDHPNSTPVAAFLSLQSVLMSHKQSPVIKYNVAASQPIAAPPQCVQPLTQEAEVTSFHSGGGSSVWSLPVCSRGFLLLLLLLMQLTLAGCCRFGSDRHSIVPKSLGCPEFWCQGASFKPHRKLLVVERTPELWREVMWNQQVVGCSCKYSSRTETSRQCLFLMAIGEEMVDSRMKVHVIPSDKCVFDEGKMSLVTCQTPVKSVNQWVQLVLLAPLTQQVLEEHLSCLT